MSPLQFNYSSNVERMIATPGYGSMKGEGGFRTESPVTRVCMSQLSTGRRRRCPGTGVSLCAEDVRR